MAKRWQTVASALALRMPARPEASYLLWVHGASVGESLSALPLVRALLASDPSSAVLMTASTATAIARLELEQLGPRVVLQPRPVESCLGLRRFLGHWRPHGLLLVESELWPAMLAEASRAGVPVALVNGRLSDRSVRRWSAAPWLRATLAWMLGRRSVARVRVRDRVRVRVRGRGRARARGRGRGWAWGWSWG